MALLFQVSCMDLSREALESMQLANGDGYTYLALVESWRDTGQWSPYVAAHNAPEGLETHLTAPFPAGVLGLARLLEPWHGRQDAPRIAGKLSGPLLHVATAAVLAWGAAAVLGTGGALLAAAGFLLMPLAPHRFGVQEFDHHGLHLFLAALLIAVLLRYVGGQARSGPTACLAGAVAGLGVWSGVEMLIPAGIGGLALGSAWLLRGDAERARGLWLYPTGMAVVLVAGVAAERPPGEWLSLDLDRASAAHVLMAVLLAAGAAGTVGLCGHRILAGVAARSVTAAAMLGSVAVVLWAAAPDFFLGPYGDSDPVVNDHLRGLASDPGAADRLAAAPWTMGYHLSLLGLVGYGVAMGLRMKVHREAWLLLAVGLFVGAVAAFYQYRLVHYYELFASIALGGAVASVGRCLWRRRSPVARLAAGPMVCVAMASPHLGWVVGALAYEADETFWSTVSRDAGCDWPALGRALAAVPMQGEGGGQYRDVRRAGAGVGPFQRPGRRGDGMSLQPQRHARCAHRSTVGAGFRARGRRTAGRRVPRAVPGHERLAGPRLVRRASGFGRALRAARPKRSARLARALAHIDGRRPGHRGIRRMANDLPELRGTLMPSLIVTRAPRVGGPAAVWRAMRAEPLPRRDRGCGLLFRVWGTIPALRVGAFQQEHKLTVRHKRHRRAANVGVK